MTYGVGNDSCGGWTESERVVEAISRSQPMSTTDIVMAAQRRSFVAGFVTAAGDPMVILNILGQAAEVNQKPITVPTTPIYRETDTSGMFAAVSKFCSEHPTLNLRMAVEMLLLDLKQKP
jgi:hypothetical protein